MKQFRNSIFITIIVIMGLIATYRCAIDYFDGKIEQLYNQKKVNIDKTSGIAEKDKGNVLVRAGLKQGEVLLLGSSELGSPVPENPKNLFPNNQFEGDVTFAGHALVQNYLQALNVGANCDSNRGDKVVIMEGLQWFFGEDIDLDGTMANFSEMQFYQCLHNKNISKENKRYMAERFIELQSRREIATSETMNLEQSQSRRLVSDFIELLESKCNYTVIDTEYDYPQTYVLAKLYLSETIQGKIAYHVIKPYYYLREKVMVLKDRYRSFKYAKGIKSADIIPNKKATINWEEMQKIAEKEGTEACTNNNLNVYDEYYSKYLKDKYEELENSSSQVTLMESKEWKDYQFFLELCKDLNVKPYIVVMSTNGLYYDYIGVEKKERDEAYVRMEEAAIEKNFGMLTLRDFEYTPYFYCDVMHLGWKGWPYVSQKMVEYYSKQ